MSCFHDDVSGHALTDLGLCICLVLVTILSSCLFPLDFFLVGLYGSDPPFSRRLDINLGAHVPLLVSSCRSFSSYFQHLQTSSTLIPLSNPLTWFAADRSVLPPKASSSKLEVRLLSALVICAAWFC